MAIQNPTKMHVNGMLMRFMKFKDGIVFNVFDRKTGLWSHFTGYGQGTELDAVLDSVVAVGSIAGDPYNDWIQFKLVWDHLWLQYKFLEFVETNF